MNDSPLKNIYICTCNKGIRYPLCSHAARTIGRLIDDAYQEGYNAALDDVDKAGQEAKIVNKKAE